MGTFSIHLHKLKPSQRFYLPAKPCLTLANIGGPDSFAELGTRFKASHIKVMLWWLALETTEFADQNPEVPCSVLLSGLKNSFVMFPQGTSYDVRCLLKLSQIGFFLYKLFSIKFLLFAQDPVLNMLGTYCYSMQRVVELMGNSGLVFSESEATEASECLRVHLKTYLWLASYHYERLMLMFKTRCKTHYLFHVADEIETTRLNPSMFQNFDEESFLVKLKRKAIRCHGATCIQRLFLRYLLCLAMYLREYSKTETRME